MLYGPRYKVDEELQIIQDNLRQQREKNDEFRSKEDEQVSEFNICNTFQFVRIKIFMLLFSYNVSCSSKGVFSLTSRTTDSPTESG